jgi:hypothetical protein
MVPIRSVLAFAGVAAILIAIPGPSVLFTISRALTAGRRAARVFTGAKRAPPTSCHLLGGRADFARPGPAPAWRT